MNPLHKQLERQLCTLDQAKQFASLGVITVSQFYFYETPDRFDWYIAHRSNIKEIDSNLWAIEENGQVMIKSRVLSAYTVGELGLMLCGSMAETTVWDIERFSFSITGKDKSKLYNHEAECRADEIFALINAGRLTIEEINEILKT